jgi:hypothetical protein
MKVSKIISEVVFVISLLKLWGGGGERGSRGDIYIQYV